MQKIIILTFNYEPANFPKEPGDDNRFFTYGFGSNFGRLLNKYLKGYEIEIWRLDSYCCGKYHEKKIDNIRYRVFRSKLICKFLHLSIPYLKELKNEREYSDPVFIVIHTHNWHTYQVLFNLKDSKIITTHHGEWSPFFISETSTGLRKIKALIEAVIEKALLKRVSFFHICDYNQINYLEKAVKKIRYGIFSTGVDIEKFRPLPKTEARKELGLDNNSKYILYVGKLYKYKQADKLIEIWKDIKQQMPETELLIVGNESPDRWGEEYYELALKSGARLFGRVLNTELYKYYSAADVYVLLALREDYFGGTGIAPLESLACNTPVVSYSMRNYIGDNLNEICECPSTLEEYRDAILKVLQNPDKYKNMRESIIKYYSYKKVAERTEQAIKTVIN
ncbi:MAG: glycosyltransferase family 4 protein [Ignavibacteria bacterium]|nr:glycosyltransferase family 4 protein [Ignavibacteria bacterium]